MKPDLHDVLNKLVESLPPDLQDKLARDVIRSVGTEKVAMKLMSAVLTNAPPFQEAVADVKKRGDMGSKLIDHTRSFLGDLRDGKGKDFNECWAAMNLMLALGNNPNSMLEMLGYALTWITFNGEVPDTPESAAAKAKAARKWADEMVDLAKLSDQMRDENL